MKYFSETLNKTFDTEKDCLKAEKDYADKKAQEDKAKKELAEKRKARAKEVEDSYQALIDSQKKYNELKQAFVKDFGSFHMTFSTQDDFSDIFDTLFRIF